MLSDIRIKLHIKASDEPEVKNLWMCLNYDQKPTVGHVMEHIKQNLLDSRDVSDCKLYLDNYWLPPYESSRLVRENDCIKVDVTYDVETKKSKQLTDKQQLATAEKIAELNQNVLNHIKSTEKRMQEKQMQVASTVETAAPVDLGASKARALAAVTNNSGDYYNHYYDQNTAYYGKSDEMSAYKYWLNNDYFNNQLTRETNVQVDLTEKSKTTSSKTQQNKPTESQKKQQPNKASKETFNGYKKFAIGNYAHMLNEPVQAPTSSETKQSKKSNKSKQQQANKKPQFQDVTESDNLSEEQLIDNYYEAIQKKAASKTSEQKYNEKSEEFDKLTNHVNSAANKKWKHSTQPAKQNGPKHIIFKTSSSDEASSESESEVIQEQQEQSKKGTKGGVRSANSPSKKISLDEVVSVNRSGKNNKYYEPSKEEQIDATSYNRSYYVKNTKNLQEFKRTFNEEKLNAPEAEEFADNSEYPLTNKSSKKSNKKQLNTSTDSSSSEKSSPRKSEAKMNYEALEKLIGAPRVNDQIAFQILEISSNFTPEVSDYKTGTVVEYDETTNEITLEMNTKYNQVLKKSNKFSVILDETDVDGEESSQGNQVEEEDILKVDWRNLMNLKLIPDAKLLVKQHELADTKAPHMVLHV